MKKASKCFRKIFGLKRSDSSSSSSRAEPQPPTTASKLRPPPKKNWSLVKSYREKGDKPAEEKCRGSSFIVGSAQPSDHDDDSSKHAIAVAAATAAVAEAAVAAAQAAAEVVRLTSSGRAVSTNATACTTSRMTSFGSGNAGAAPVQSSPAYVSGSGAGYGSREEWAAVKIQSHFRAYLSRRALRALKALVKLQALVRGQIVRKHTADLLREMQARIQAMLRAQARASAGRAQIFESPHKSNLTHYTGPDTPEKFEHIAQCNSMKHGENLIFRRDGSKNGKILSNQGSRMDINSWEKEGSCMKIGPRVDEMNDKVLEIDTAGPQILHKRRNLFHSCHRSIGSEQCSHSFTTSKDSTAHQTFPSLSSCEVQSVSPLKFSNEVDDDPFCTAENSPQFLSTSSKGGISKRGPFTPTSSAGSRSCCLSGYSDYPNYMSCTQSSKAKMRSLSAPKLRPQYERSSSTKRLSIHGYGESRINPQRVSALHANFTGKAYPGSGHLDRLGMPVNGF